MSFKLTSLQTKTQLAFKASNPNSQKLEKMQVNYPLITKTQWLNAMMDYYLTDALKFGVDKYLRPMVDVEKKPRKPAA